MDELLSVGPRTLVGGGGICLPVGNETEIDLAYLLTKHQQVYSLTCSVSGIQGKLELCHKTSNISLDVSSQGPCSYQSSLELQGCSMATRFFCKL